MLNLNPVVNISSNQFYQFAVDLNINYGSFPGSNNPIAGSGVHLGNGIILTAAHNFTFSEFLKLDPTDARIGEQLPNVTADIQQA